MNLSNFTQEQIQTAREKVALEKEKIARECLDGGVSFADHVTEERKREKSAAYLELAKEIRRGEHDHNLSIRQRMYFYITGEDVPFMNF